MGKVTLDSMRKAREVRIPAGAYTFIAQRPTDYDVIKAQAEGVRTDLDWVSGYITGWEGVSESDLVPGGNPEPADFDQEVFCLWIKDKRGLWGELTSGFVKAYTDYQEAAEGRGNA